MNVYDWPLEWYKFTETSFNLQSNTIQSQSTFTPRINSALTFQNWQADFVLRPEVGPSKWQKYGAFFSRIKGPSNIFRIGDPLRCVPLHNRNIMRGIGEPWSDDTYFTDGTGWSESGLVPPTASLLEGANRGDLFIKIKGLTPNLTPALHPGDLLELRVNGIPSVTSNLYEVVVAGPTNGNGETGVEIAPGLRQSFAPNDMVVLWHPRGSFRLVDNGQGMINRRANVGTIGFSGIEHVA